jgi:hypothetical protein
MRERFARIAGGVKRKVRPSARGPGEEARALPADTAPPGPPPSGAHHLMENSSPTSFSESRMVSIPPPGKSGLTGPVTVFWKACM